MLFILFYKVIGIKCENHSCSITAVEKLLGEEKVKIINEHKLKRIDAQYYMKIIAKSKIEDMLTQAKSFIVEFDTFVSNLSSDEIEKYRIKFKELIKNKDS